jgi:hypothetical protein
MSCLEVETNAVPPPGFLRLPSNLVEDVMDTVPMPSLLPTTKLTRAMYRTLLTAERPASLQKFHVSARHLLMFVASLSVPLPKPPQLAHSISPCTPKELLS